jgi:hypothetical protein
MGKAITVDQLGAEIKKILDEYEGDITRNIPEITEKIGKKGALALRNSSKSAVNGNKYWKGWKSTIFRERMVSTAIIHNAKLPGLPHLLEHGHAKVGGGRVAGRVHIAPVEEKLIDQYEKEIINEIE